ncbi:NUDIX hydrolase [Arthrobacter sp. TMN-49]
MIERRALTPVSYVILRRGDKVLLQLRQGTGYMDGHWSTAAAGHVEADESVCDAACREAREELGVVIAATDLVAFTTMHRFHHASTEVAGRVDFFFTCEVWDGNPKTMEHDKSAGLAWFDLDGLPEALVPHERFILENLRTGLPPIVSFGFSTL